MRILPRTRWVLFWVTLVVAFLSLSSAALLYTYGYRVNWQVKQLERPGLLRILSNPKDVTVRVDGKVVAQKTTVTVRLFPGSHTATLGKDGYHTWTKRFDLESGMVRRFDDILLFTKDPAPVSVTDKTVVTEVKNAPFFGSGIQVFDTEIWYRDRFVTRFSTKPSAAVALSNRAYLLFQIEKEVHSIEVDGGNDTKLLTLSSGGSTRLVLKEDGHVLLYIDGETVKQARIR